MVNELIELYYYIRSTEDIKDLDGWTYYTGDIMHHVYPDTVYINPTYTEQDWRFKITVGNVNAYRRIFLFKNRVFITDTLKKYSYSIHIPDIITKDECDKLMNYISTDEITIMNQIYVEMHKLLNRSESGRTNS